jgi:hypothetical protein
MGCNGYSVHEGKHILDSNRSFVLSEFHLRSAFDEIQEFTPFFCMDPPLYDHVTIRLPLRIEKEFSGISKWTEGP